MVINITSVHRLDWVHARTKFKKAGWSSRISLLIFCSISKKKLKKAIFSSNYLAMSGNVVIFASNFYTIMKIKVVSKSSCEGRLAFC